MIGRPYSKEQADETALLMSVDHVADQLFKEDVKRGRVKEEQRDKPLFYDANYIRPARKMIEEAFRNPPKETAKKPEVPGKKTAFGAPMSPEAMKKALESMPPAMRAAFEQMTPEERSAAMKMFASRDAPCGNGARRPFPRDENGKNAGKTEVRSHTVRAARAQGADRFYTV